MCAVAILMRVAFAFRGVRGLDDTLRSASAPPIIEIRNVGGFLLCECLKNGHGGDGEVCGERSITGALRVCALWSPGFWDECEGLSNGEVEVW